MTHGAYFFILQVRKAKFIILFLKNKNESKKKKKRDDSIENKNCGEREKKKISKAPEIHKIQTTSVL